MSGKKPGKESAGKLPNPALATSFQCLEVPATVLFAHKTKGLLLPKSAQLSLLNASWTSNKVIDLLCGKPKYLSNSVSFNLESSVARREGCVCGGARQGITTSNSCSIARSYNAAMRHHKRSIRGVTILT
jgi:hypothetical protein